MMLVWDIYMNKKNVIRNIFMISCLLSTFSSHVLSQPQTENTESLSLQVIMQQLGTDLETITKGISQENWELVTKKAILIRDHPQASMKEKKRIKVLLGEQMSQFKTYDLKTHEAANSLVDAAKNKEGFQVISFFSELQNSCLACHQQFRKRLSE